MPNYRPYVQEFATPDGKVLYRIDRLATPYYYITLPGIYETRENAEKALRRL